LIAWASKEKKRKEKKGKKGGKENEEKREKGKITWRRHFTYSPGL
jgi:hypothetical protein